MLEHPKQKSSYAEWSIEKTNQQINETENELMQCEQRLRNLNLKSNELKTSAAKLYDRSNFSEESKFRGNNLNRQNGDYDAYNKQFGYSTVYNNKYKNSSCISKNQIKNINSASNHIPSKASYSISSGDLLNKATSSSAYGSFFNKYRF